MDKQSCGCVLILALVVAGLIIFFQNCTGSMETAPLPAIIASRFATEASEHMKTVESNLNTPHPFQATHASTISPMDHVDNAFMKVDQKSDSDTLKPSGFVRSWSAKPDEEAADDAMVTQFYNTFDESASARSANISQQPTIDKDAAKAAANASLYADMSKASLRSNGSSKARTIGLNPNSFCRATLERPLNNCSVSFLDSGERQDAVNTGTGCFNASQEGVEACGFAQCKASPV